jgi:hypothetical protein
MPVNGFHLTSAPGKKTCQSQYAIRFGERALVCFVQSNAQRDVNELVI